MIASEARDPSRTAFSQEDIRQLVRGPTDEDRAAVAHRLCRRIERDLTPDEREAAQEVLRLMSLDAAEMVRRALAVTLKASDCLPHDVAMRLAQDIDSIAAPVLAFSPAFTDEDLAEIVRVSGEAKQVAVAERAALGGPVALALAEHGAASAVERAISNDNASFGDDAFASVLERFADNPAITTGMTYRRALPLSISERLVHLVTEEARRHLVDHHQLSPETALRVALGARERATVDLVDQAARTSDLKAFCAHLHRQERLTASLLLRAVAQGCAEFFEWSLAELAGVPHHRAWLLVHDAGPLGLRALYERAGLPPRLLPAFRAGLDAHRSLQSEGGVRDPRRFQQRMLERFLTQATAAPKEDVDYLLDRLDRLDRSLREPARVVEPAPIRRSVAA